MNKETLMRNLLRSEDLQDFYSAYEENPELAETISAAIIKTVTEVAKRESNRFSMGEAQELLALQKQIGVERSSKDVTEKSFLPYKVQRAYASLRSFLKEKGSLVPVVELRKQPFFQQPEIKDFILKQYPKGLSFQDVGNFMEFFKDRKNYTVMRGEYGEGIQTLDSVKKYPRKTFILTIQDLLAEIGKQNDRYFDIFINQMLANGVHEESIGVPGKTFGWVIYREIDENTLFIEQIQTDLYRVFHRIQKGIEHFGLSPEYYRQVVRQLGGDQKVEEIESTLSKYVENYFEVLLSAFMEEYPGKELYLSSPEIIAQTVPDGPPLEMYKKLPLKYKFKETTEAPFDTQGLPVFYRHNAMRKVQKYSRLRRQR